MEKALFGNPLNHFSGLTFYVELHNLWSCVRFRFRLSQKITIPAAGTEGLFSYSHQVTEALAALINIDAGALLRHRWEHVCGLRNSPHASYRKGCKHRKCVERRPFGSALVYILMRGTNAPMDKEGSNQHRFFAAKGTVRSSLSHSW